jgi:hypothetical protein
MTTVLSLAIIIGLLNCYKTISDTRVGITPSAKPSKNNCSFFFIDL